MIGDGRDAAASLRAMIVADLDRSIGPVTTTVRCVNAETCGLRFSVMYLPRVNPPCPRCGAASTLVRVMRA